jgi:hypothetical protein
MQTKYGNIKVKVDGIEFDSTKEANYYRDLKLSMHATNEHDRVVDIIVQPEYDIDFNGVKICTYIGDFEVTYADRRVEVIDVKSDHTRKLPVYRLKKKLMKARYNIDILER